MVDNKEKTEEELEKKEKPKPFWQTLPPVVLIAGMVVLFLMFKSMSMDEEGGNTYFIMILGAIAVIYFLSKGGDNTESKVTPKEADILVENECERKLRWGQFKPMSKCQVGPVSDIMHRDARGCYYNVAVKVTNPYYPAEYYTAKVMASGDEKKYVTLIESIGPLTGRKIQQEVDISHIPQWIQRPKKYPFLETLWSKREK